MLRYSFDTSSLINGRRDLLPPKVFPRVWEDLEDLIAEGSIRAVSEVREELRRKEGDVITAWAEAQEGLFVELDADIQRATREVLDVHPRLTGRGRGRNQADPFVIGMARARGVTVVTEETMSGNVANPRIPDVCDAMGVPWLNLVRFIETEDWRY